MEARADAAVGASELSRLRAEAATLESEREMRRKLEKLLEVQKVQVDLHKELRVKTESLLQVEQQTTSKLRQQLDQARTSAPPSAAAAAEGQQHRLGLEQRFAQAQERIAVLESQLQESSAPETSDRAQAQLQKQLEEQERIIGELKAQMAREPVQPNEAVRLQMLLQARDKQVEEMTQSLHRAQNDVAEAQSEAEVLKHQVRVLKKEVSERTDEMERQLSAERSLRADVFQHKATIDKLTQQLSDESQRATGYAATAATADEAQLRIRQLEHRLAEEQTTAQREKDKVATESEYRLQQREQTMRNQTITIESLNRELKEKQEEIDKLLRSASPKGDRDAGGLAALPPLAAQSPRPLAEDVAGQRSLESLHKQLRSKDAKIAKQTERLQHLTEMLEKRDQQLEELSTARRDRELMRQKLADAEEAMQTQTQMPRVVTHAEAERRLIEQEQLLRERERRVRDLEEGLRQESSTKDSLTRELGALRGHLAEGASSTGALQEENARLSRELTEMRRQHDARVEELRRAREALSEQSAGAAMPTLPAAPALQRKLQRLEEMDKNLSRDIAVFLQDRENKIESLNSTIVLLRQSVDDARRSASAGGGQPGPGASPGIPSIPASPGGASVAAASVASDSRQPDLTAPPRLPPLSARDTAGASSPSARRSPPLQQSATAPLGQGASPVTLPEIQRPGSRGPVARSPSLPTGAQQSSTAAAVAATTSLVSVEDLRNASAEELRHELLSRRQECSNLEHQIGEKQQLVLRLIEEANLCNAEVASLQQTVQQAAKDARKQTKEYDKLFGEKEELDKLTKKLQQTILDQEQKVANLLQHHLEDTSGNAAVDEVDQGVTWKLQTMAPRKHEIRHSLFIVLNRGNREPLVKARLEAGLANILAITSTRVEVVQDSMLPTSCSPIPQGGVGMLEDADAGRSPSPPVYEDEAFDDLDHRRAASPLSQDSTKGKSDLVLVNIVDFEIREDGTKVPSVVHAVDALDHIRSDMMKGLKLPPIDNVSVAALFLNHGDMVLPYEWPSAQSRLLLREGRVIAGKHAVVTMHEVRDPYALRIVAFDMEAGREFILFLHSRDVLLLLDSRDCESARERADAAEAHDFLQGPIASEFRSTGSVSDPALLNVIIGSLSFSVWQGQQILVASEMRVPFSLASVDKASTSGGDAAAADASPSMRSTGKQLALAEAMSVGMTATALPPEARASEGMELMEHRPQSLHPAVLPEVGVTRGFRPPSRSVRLLYEDVIVFEDKLCIFSLSHTTRSDLTEDVLRARLYYPKTCASVEACLTEPMLSDRLRIVAEVGSISDDELLSVAIVVEEIIYPPAFVIRITSVCLDDAYKMSPKEEVKPHSHIIRVTKDTASVLHCPDISFAVSPSTMRNKLLRCICLSSATEGPRETLLNMPGLVSVLGKDTRKKLNRKTVTGHVNDSCGLQIQLIGEDSGGKPPAQSLAIQDGSAADGGAAAPPKLGEMNAVMRAKLRSKYGKGKLLVRHGRMIAMKCTGFPDASIRAVVSVYERPNPYQHFVMSAYEPQTSREWEVLADSIDIFKLFVDRSDTQAPPDLANPMIRQMIAESLVQSVELHNHRDELTLVMSPQLIRENIQKARDAAALRDSDAEPERTGTEPARSPSRLAQDPIEPFEAHPAISRQLVTAVGGFTGGFQDREDAMRIEQRLADLLFTGHIRLNPLAYGPGDPYKIQIYDRPSATALHSYVVVATPVNQTPVLAQNLPVADMTVHPQKTTKYTLKVDDKALEGYLWDTKLLEPSRQEELLHYICQSLHLDADRMGQLRLNLRKHKIRVHQVKDAIALIGETGAAAPSSVSQEVQLVPEGGRVREVGGSFPLNRLNLKVAKGKAPRGPSLREAGPEGSGSLFLRDWKKVYSMAQRFGSTTIIITVSRRDRTFRLSVYEPDTSALYEMCLATASSSTPMNVLMERCDLAGKLDLVLVMSEVPFPHQVSIHLVHMGSSQEFNLKIGDDLVYTMLENSRRDAFMLFMEQLITWGCIGFQAAPGREEEATADIWEETFAGNQIFDRTPIHDVLQANLSANTVPESGELKTPGALALAPVQKLRVPVIRTHLDTLGKKPPPSTVLLQLLYHGERALPEMASGGDKVSVLLRVHRRATTGDIAVTLRTRQGDLSLPQLPQRCQVPAGSANGRPFSTPALGAAESAGAGLSEVTVWMQDKSSRTPCGAYGEICEVPGIEQPLLVLITDEDSPRAVRVCVTLSRVPFTVLFQVVLLETTEVSARVDGASNQKTHSGRRVLKQVFQKRFGLRKSPVSAAMAYLTSSSQAFREKDVRAKLDELDATEDAPEHLGFTSGHGSGGPSDGGLRRLEEIDETVDSAIINISTRLKIGRMMIFNVFRDLVGHNMYLRVVMHDPVIKKDFHLTLMHYTTQRLFSILRVNRDMLEDNRDFETEEEKSDRQTLRAELGKLITDHLYLTRTVADKDGNREVIDKLDLNDDDELEYELHMRDIMVPSNAAHLSMKRKLLEDTGSTRRGPSPQAGALAALDDAPRSLSGTREGLALSAESQAKRNDLEPRTLLQMKEEHLIHKMEKTIAGRRVMVAFYNETTQEDILVYSHNLRIVVACLQSLEILYTMDLHEDSLEPFCAQREKRHLMSATREADLVVELASCLQIQHVGTTPTGIKFASTDEGLLQ